MFCRLQLEYIHYEGFGFLEHGSGQREYDRQYARQNFPDLSILPDDEVYLCHDMRKAR